MFGQLGKSLRAIRSRTWSKCGQLTKPGHFPQVPCVSHDECYGDTSTVKDGRQALATNREVRANAYLLSSAPRVEADLVNK
jgi:hypothetical protein